MAVDPAIVDAINSAFEGEYRCLSVVRAEPELLVGPAPELDAALADERKRQLQFIADTGRRNEIHLLADDDYEIAEMPPRIPVYEADYARVRALRALGRPAAVVGGGVLAVCPTSEELFLQMRSADSDLNPSRLNTFTGGHHGADEGSLIRASIREFAEETGVLPGAPGTPGLALCRHTVWRTVELILLGVALGAQEASRLHDTEEGRIVRVPFADLEEILKGGGFDGGGTSACLLHILLWLAMDAPPVGGDAPLFGGATAGAALRSALAGARPRARDSYAGAARKR